MKKFEFRLEKILNYKDQLLKEEKNTLSEIRAKRLAAENEFFMVKNKLAAANENYIMRSQKGMTAEEMIAEKRYMTSLSDNIRELLKILKIYDEKIEIQLAVVIDAGREVNTLQKLQEKQLEVYKDDCMKDEEKFIDEFVRNRQSVLV